MAERDDKEAARAITDYRTLDHAGQKLAWLELRPLTGRTHQLRVHCVAIGAPILGDVKYARPDQNNAFAATIDGLSSELHLHARALRLPHPAGGTLVVEAELPPHMTRDVSHPGVSRPPRHARRSDGNREEPVASCVCFASVCGRVSRWWCWWWRASASFCATFNPNSFKPQIIAAVQRATGRELTLQGRIHLGLSLQPTLTIQDVSMANPAGFSRPRWRRCRNST